MKTIAPFVAEPVPCPRFVDPRLKTGNTILIGFYADIAAGAAAGANGRRLLEIPDTHFEAEITVRQRAHGTDIDGIGGKRVIEKRVGKQRDRRMIPGIDGRKFVGSS